MSKRFPTFRLSEKELSAGNLVFVGELVFGTHGSMRRKPVVLAYPLDTPFRVPTLTPVSVLPDGNDWAAADVLRPDNVFRMPEEYRRHQMPDGSICLIEADSHLLAESISGTLVLQRAKEVFKAIATGRPFPYPDSEQSELEAHFKRTGDIVLPPCFYDPSLSGRGLFYACFHVDFDPAQAGFILQNDPPRTLLVGVNISEATASGIELDFLNSVEPSVARAYPWLGNPELTFKGMTRNDRLRNVAVKGRWYDLAQEPEPCRNGAELEEILRQAGFDDATDAVERFAGDPDTLMLIGLRYPSRDGGKDWLVLRLVLGEEVNSPEFQQAVRADKREHRSVARAADVHCFRVHTLQQRDLQSRNANTLPTNLADKKVLILGVGAVGGDVAVTLAKAGIGQLTLVDSDELRLGNVIRHVSGLALTGLRKTDAVRHNVWQHNPYVDVEAVAQRIGEDPGRLEELMTESDLAVSTVADENVEMVINEVAIRLDLTVIYGRALRGGAASRIFRVRPGLDACKSCLARYRTHNQDTEAPHTSDPAWVDLPPLEDEIVDRECGRPILAGSAVDLRLTSDLTARATIDELSTGQDWNMLVWSRDTVPDASPAITEPYTLIRQSFKPRSDCPVCRRPQTEKIVVSEEARADIVRYTEDKPDVETGGILIGFRDTNGSMQVLAATAAGPKAVEERNRFERDHKYCQDRLDEAAAKYGEHGQYIGEWHSHLQTQPQPSARDIESLTGIADAPNYHTNEPIMLIAGLDPNSRKVKHINGSCFPLGMRCIDRDVVLATDQPPGPHAKKQHNLEAE